MVAWNDYKEIAKSRGALALELYVVETVPQSPPEEVKKNLEAHLAYQRELEQQGALALAGPLSNDTGDEMEGAGMILYRAQSMADAAKLAEADPMHKSGARSYTLRKWLINEGSLNLAVGLSTGKAVLS